jgi:hypothetical protein
MWFFFRGAQLIQLWLVMWLHGCDSLKAIYRWGAEVFEYVPSWWVHTIRASRCGLQHAAARLRQLEVDLQVGGFPHAMFQCVS